MDSRAAGIFQKYFRDVKEDSFTAWNESRLRQFLLDNDIIEPKGTKVSRAFSSPSKPNKTLSSSSPR